MSSLEKAELDSIRDSLAALVAKKDPSIFQNLETFERHLQKQSGKSGPAIDALKAGLSEKLPWTLRQPGQPPPLAKDVIQIRETLQRKYGITPLMAAWGLTAWAEVMGVSLPQVPVSSVPSGNSQPDIPISLGLEFAKDQRGNLRIRKVWTRQGKLAGTLVEHVKPQLGLKKSFPHMKSAERTIPPEGVPKHSPQGPAGEGATLPKSVKPSTPQGSAPGSTTSRKATHPTPKHLGPSPAMPTKKVSSPEATKPPRSAPTDAQGMLQEGLKNLGSTRMTGNFHHARRWFEMAAEKGLAAAKFQLGLIHLRGRGVPEDVVAARKWFQAAAAQGNADAQTQIGIVYQCGYGVPIDLAEAKRWFELAAVQGHVEAKECLENLTGVL